MERSRSWRPYGTDVTQRLKRMLSLGNTIDPADAYRAFRERDPLVEALKKRGFTDPPTSR